MKIPNLISLLRTLVPGAIVSLLLPASLAAQTTAARPDRGIMPGASYSVSDIENINLSNGNLQLRIPLASLPPIAGDKLKLTLNATYNSKLWNITRTENRMGEEFGCPSWVVDSPQESDLGGWSIAAGYRIVFREASEDFDYVIPNPPPGPDCEPNLIERQELQHTLYRAVVISPDGSEHELRTMEIGNYGGFRPYLQSYHKGAPDTVGLSTRYYSFDGSYLWATINPSSHSTRWTITLKDGTRVVQYSNGIQRITDINGNSIKIFADINGTHIQDEQTDREIRIGSDNKIWYRKPGGEWANITIVWGTTTVQGKLYRVNNWVPTGGESGGGTHCWHDQVLNSTLPVIREIVFPQTEPGQPAPRYVFSYNSDETTTASNQVLWACGGPGETYNRTVSKGLGALSQITTPTGAIVKYSYSKDLKHSFSLFGDTDDIARETLTQKQIIHDGITDTWTYNIIEFNSCGGTVTASDGSVTTETCYPKDPAQGQFFGNVPSKAGLTYRSRRSNVELVERHWTTTPFSGANPLSTGSFANATFNPVVDVEYTTLLDTAGNPVKMSAKTFQYDFNGNLTQTKEYDWFDPALVSRDAEGVPTGVPAGATLLRTTNHSYYNQADGSTSTNVYAKRSVSTGTPLILNALKETTVGQSIVQLSYDGQDYGVAPTIGNLTRKKVWVDLDSKWITTSNTYGPFGNIAITTDARGKETQFFYEDNTHALPTRVVVDPQNGTGLQTTTTAFDYHTGLVTSQTDVNGQQSTIDYTNHLLGTIDPFGRPGVTKSPTINISGVNHRRLVKTTYFDSARQVIVETDLNAENDKLLKTRMTTDMLGRPVLTESTEDGTNYTISVKNRYLNMGQVTLTSSPMRSTAASTDSWTRVTKDIAGRVTQVATFGGAVQPAWTGTAGAFTGALTSAYDANFTTVTDQAGKVRRSMTDALGRLTRVDEPDANGNLGPTATPVQPTSYAYSVLDNLTSVTQGAQTRTFTYDSLSRLRSAVNPESGAITYKYDDNGNLEVKTDARDVSAHYAYDSLNRLTRRWYNSSTSTLDTTHNLPALPSSVGATNEVKFFYDTQVLPTGAPSYTRGSAIGRLVAQTYGTGTNGDYFAYDVLGRATQKFQQTGAVNYQLTAGYTLSGALKTLTYPSNRTITNTFDQAGRLTGFNGNLGDGVTRTYATGNLYSPLGSLLKEQFGTNTAVYHKIHYNSRSQICDVRASNVNDEWGGELGALVNHYSTAWVHCGSGPDNNGNLLMSQTIINSILFEDRYSYDSLNRLTAVSEYQNGTSLTGTQEYDYDRWGNRTIKPTSTLGTNKQFTVNAANNRLGVPSGQSGVMSYDLAGNLTNDTYTGAGNRTYDAENKITSAWGGNNQAQLYRYDGSGNRIKRTVDGVETWQVYGFGGELIAEYAANGAVTSPKKEYGYRNGQLLITAEAAAAATNVALASNGATVTASSTWSNPPFSYLPSSVNNGDHRGLNPANNSNWTSNGTSLPQWVEVAFNGSKTINQIDVFSLQDNYQNPIEPSESTSFSLYGLTAFQMQYWNNGAWTTVPGGSVTGNNKVWKKITFAPLTTTKIRVHITATSDNWSRIVEVEAWTPGAPPPNVALASNGTTVTASSTWSNPPFSYHPSSVNNGDHRGLNPANNSNWTSNGTSLPQWVEVAFNGSKTINQIDVFSLQDNYQNPIEPTESMTFSLYGLTSFEVQYWNNGAWTTVPGGSVSGNNKVWKKITFAPLTTTKIRVHITATSDNWSRIVEVEAWTDSPGANINWLVSDHLGTPRMLIDQTGTLANVKRHDYLPFGEELFAPIGGRSAALGYAGADSMRQQFTSKERDVETGLDYFLARYYSSTQGRFTSPDEPFAGQFEEDPQTWNLYAYTSNNPLARVDADGKRWFYKNIYDENGELINRDVIWVDANEDGTYTSPGEGWIAFIPTKERPEIKTCTKGILGECRKVAYLGENSDGSPKVEEYWTGRTESANEHIMGALLGARILLSIRSAPAAYTAWRLARAQEKWDKRGEIKISPEQTRLLYQFFGNGPEGAINRMNNFYIPRGLTRETLEKYAEIARRTINANKDTRGTQAERLKLVEKALKETKN